MPPRFYKEHKKVMHTIHKAFTEMQKSDALRSRGYMYIPPCFYGEHKKVMRSILGLLMCYPINMLIYLRLSKEFLQFEKLRIFKESM